MSEAARIFDDYPIRKPPASEGQYNWITGAVDVMCRSRWIASAAGR
jgi:hypothetical protein